MDHVFSNQQKKSSSIFFLLFVFLAIPSRLNECRYDPSFVSQPGFPQHGGMKSDSPTCSPTSTPDNNPVKTNDKKKRSFIPKLFGKRGGDKGSSDGELYTAEQDELTIDIVTSRRSVFMEDSPVMMKKSFSEIQTNSRIEGLNLSRIELSMAPAIETQQLRMFVATWNVGGRTPENTLNLEEFLQVETPSDIYVLGFQEIVPLNAGNVLVVEDSEPAAKWLILINQALNPKPNHLLESDLNNGAKSPTSHNLFHKPSVKVLSRNFRADNRHLKACNCIVDGTTLPVNDKLDTTTTLEVSSYPSPTTDSSSYDFLRFADAPISPNLPSGGEAMPYRLVTSKQMVGIFLAVWARNEVADHIGHLRVCSVGRGILGRLGNKGCISISMSLHETSFCLVCSHLASGEKDGDELKRNSDVLQIIKNTHFPKVCKKSYQLEPENIIDHDRVIWMGDLNYRISMTYEETRVLVETRDWDTLLGRDQLNLEREAGRVFNGFKEGKIIFAPTYKYCQNSDTYSGETIKTKKKRRTPAWCDRILWRGNGIEQLSYMRWESKFSDHRPVSSLFTINVEVRSVKAKFQKGYSCAAGRLQYRDPVPPRRSVNDL